jgi:hypothetical protein
MGRISALFPRSDSSFKTMPLCSHEKNCGRLMQYFLCGCAESAESRITRVGSHPSSERHFANQSINTDNKFQARSYALLSPALDAL